ncbi:MAG: cupin domain-containing protein [Deltaproteobacteria bacterium]|nr:MAG: cupin domain-containing protein [Deltaproteobacteria bacterium]
MEARDIYEDGGLKTAYDKPRLFFRELTGFTYSLARELKKLRSIPRVIKGKDLKFKSGPQYFNSNILTPKNNTAQALYAHLVVLAPGAKSHRHGHVNEAPFYILDGKGYDVHDGKRYDWKAGDICIVPNACVHQHFNADDRNFARALIIKSKPLYLFMNMLFQDTLEENPKTPVPGHEDFEPSIT